MLDRVSLDGIDGAEMLALNSDIRTLNATVVRERIQLGRTLTKGLGTGGDPELGQKVVLEAENEVRAAIKGRKIVFLCVGLGGGTGSGAAPIVTRIAREEGAFVVVFATMPFFFEGRRRREQAETALNELAVLSNALVTFDNNRMGELVLAKHGIHEAFSAGDRMISDSIQAVIRLVIQPGLIHIGLDELMTALRTTRSRCLFGSGVANGKDRASKALTNALASPLLDKGTLLREASSVLVHICGGQDLTLHEVNLLMEKLIKFVPAKAHVLFGAAIDAKMQDNLSITLISALPENKLQETPAPMADLQPSIGFDFIQPDRFEPADSSFTDPTPENVQLPPAPTRESEPALSLEARQSTEEPFVDPISFEIDNSPVAANVTETSEENTQDTTFADVPVPDSPKSTIIPPKNDRPQTIPSMDDIDRWAGPLQKASTIKTMDLSESPFAESPAESEANLSPATQAATAAKELRAAIKAPPQEAKISINSSETGDFGDLFRQTREKLSNPDELFQSNPRGRFATTEPSVIDGEDLDIPAFLRKKKK